MNKPIRIIKFRIWDADNKHMVYYNPVSATIPFMTINGLFYNNGKIENKIPIQSTNVYDQNNNEIYESDYINFIDDEIDKNFIVEWNDNDAGFFLFEVGGNDVLRLSKQFSQNMKIVGNIYEGNIK